MRTFVLILTLGFLALTSSLARADKTYINRELASDAIRLEAALQTATAAEPGTFLPTSTSAKTVIANKSDAASWLRYSNELANAVERTDNTFFAYQHNALDAAYIAYQRARNPGDEASALQQVGAIFSAQQQWREALNADLASLDRFENAKLRAAYVALRARYGFRILSYSVDNEVADPRACFQFSEKLDKHRADYAPFVAVDGMANAAVSAQDSQICVEGLQHGQRYHIVLRKGIPSLVRESLLKDAGYDIYVKDRSPQAHFSGSTYILPRLGQQGIPVTSVNTQKVGLRVLRVGDRNLLDAIHSGGFLKQLEPYQARQLIEKSAIKVWSGTMDVASKLNRDVVTAFPVMDAVGTMAPGLYVLIATPDSKSATETRDETAGMQMATQWFVVSDLGLTVFSSADGTHVMVRSLATTKPLEAVTLRLVARSNEVLGSVASGADGMGLFDPGLSRGKSGMAPSLLVATDAQGDYNFIDLAAAPFDLTDRGVQGHAAVSGLDALVFPERGVYRSGESVHVTAILRDARGEAAPAVPVILVIKRPDGVEDRRIVSADQGLGGHTLDLPLLSGAAVGTWNIEAFSDPKSPAIGHASFLVEDYVPDHLDMVLKPQAQVLRLGQMATIDTTTRYLYGAKGAGLALSGDVTLEAANSAGLASMKGYQIGLTDEPFESVRASLDHDVTTNALGEAVVAINIPNVGTPRALEAKINLRVAEPGGRAITRQIVLPVLPKTNVIGIAKDFGDARLAEGEVAGFHLAMFDNNGDAIAQNNVRWSLFRVTHHLQYYKQDGAWDYEDVTATAKVASGVVNIAADQPAAIRAPVLYGTYRLQAETGNAADPPTSVSFEAGYGDASSTDTPDLLKVTLDKDQYNPADQMQVHISSRFAGAATLAIASDRFTVVKSIEIAKGDNLVSLPVQAGWGSGAYLVAIAHRALDVAQKRMPGRSMGVVWFGIGQNQHRLMIKLAPPETMTPRAVLDVPITLAGLKPGEQAFVSVAAVDVGILNLTQYHLPDAFDHVFGQRQLATDIRDVYGHLIDGMQGARGAVRSGGDASGGVNDAAKPSQAPLALFSGPVTVDAQGKAHVSFDIPQFNGTARLMASAWSAHAVGSASTDVIIRDPVVVTMSQPRFLSLHDTAKLHVLVDNVAGVEGDYQVNLATPEAVAIASDAATRLLHLSVGGRQEFEFPITASTPGTAKLALHISGPGLDATQTTDLDVLPGTTPLFHRFVQQLAAGSSVSLTSDLTADFVPGTGSVTVAVSSLGGLDVAGLLQALDTYPYRCSEQSVSRALPLLYRGASSSEPPAVSAKVEIDAAITRVLSRQDSTGSFGLWSAGSDNDVWLSAYVMDFLTRAREASFEVPQAGLQSGLDYLANSVANAGQISESNSSGIAYALYVLARNGRPVMGDLRYLSATQIGSFTQPLARAQLAASFALLGDTKGSAQIFAQAIAQLEVMKNKPSFDGTYGSPLRDSAGMVALAAESHAPDAIIERAAVVMRDANAGAINASTQEEAWMVRAGQVIAARDKSLQLVINNQPNAGAYISHFSGAQLAEQPIQISNAGDKPAQIVVTTAGNPLVPEPPAANGYAVKRRLFTLDGTALDGTSIVQNQRLVVVLDLVEPKAESARVLLVDHLPAGLEIENPDVLSADSGAPLPFLRDQPPPVHSEYRDDRFIAAFNRDAGAGASFSIGYVVRAITPGHFTWPAATIEDMYRPNRYGRTANGTLDVVGAR